MILLQLFWAFFKIGLFSFGGGYAMIQIIQAEVLGYGWVSAKEFADIVAISQMTPGPIAVNAATYVGVKAAGIPGSFFATFGVSLPSFILIVLIAKFFIKFKENLIVDSVLRGIRPVTIGMIGSAVIYFAGTSFITSSLTLNHLWQVFTSGSAYGILQKINIHPGATLIFAIILVATKKFKLHPIAAVLVSAILGIFLT